MTRIVFSPAARDDLERVDDYKTASFGLHHDTKRARQDQAVRR
jgi:hypothetical protein